MKNLVSHEGVTAAPGSGPVGAPRPSISAIGAHPSEAVTAGSPVPEAAARGFVESFARALHRYGLPAHRLEDALAALAVRFGFEGGFFATPTAIFITLARDGEQRTSLLRLDPGEINLDKLARLDEILKEVIDGALGAEAGTSSIQEIVQDRDRHGPFAVAAGYALAAGAASRYFGGGLNDLVVCAVIGLAIGALGYAGSRLTSRLRVMESAAASIAGVVAALAAAWLPPVSTFVATCAGVIVLLPGLALTLAINELATRNLSSGAVRLANALLTFLQIGFGLAVGLEIGTSIAGSPPPVTPTPLPDWTVPLAVAGSAIALTILFQARRRDFGWILLGAAVAFGAARYGSALHGPELGAFVGALTVGLASNAFARLCNRSAHLLLMPGIMLIVPGSVGFRSVASLLEADVLGGVQFGFTMVMTGVALVTGLLIAGGIIPPRRSV